MKRLAFLILLCAYSNAWTQKSPDYVERRPYGEHDHALVCPKYQHEEWSEFRCIPGCSDPEREKCDNWPGVGVCHIEPTVHGCVAELHVVTEQEWQELMARLKALEAAKGVRLPYAVPMK